MNTQVSEEITYDRRRFLATAGVTKWRKRLHNAAIVAAELGLEVARV